MAALALGLTLMCVGAGRGHADRVKIAVVEFSGPRAGALQAAVEDAIETQHELVPGERYTRVANKLKARKPTPRNVARVAKRLGAGAVLTGEVARRRKTYELTLSLRRASDGELVGTIELSSRKPKLSRQARRKLQRELARLVAGLDAQEPGNADEPPSEGEGEGGSEPAGDDDAPAAQDADDEAPEGGETPARLARSSDDGEPSETGASKDRAPWLDIAGGLSVTNRTLSFTVAPGIANAPQRYRGTPVAGAHVAAAFYPMARTASSGSIPGRIGVQGTFDRVLRIQSRFTYDDANGQAMQVALGTEQMRWGVGLTVRLMGASARGAMLEARMGYSRLRFIIDKAQAPPEAIIEVPNVDYAYLDPGLVARYPFTRSLALAASGHFLYVMQTGEIETTPYFGTASVYGFDADAGIEYSIGSRLSVRAGGRFMSMFFGFKGDGVASTLRDNDPATLDVPRASDRYLGGYLTAGYLF